MTTWWRGRLALEFLRRDWRAGELNLLMAAVAIAVAAVATVGFFTDRLEGALNAQARQLIGGDVVVRSDRPIPKDWAVEAQNSGLQVAETIEFPSMVLSGEKTLLVSLKAVSSSYPLRGELQVRESQGHATAARSGPPSGSVWVDPTLLTALDRVLGQSIDVGSSSMRIAGVLESEPDRGASFLDFAPRVMMSSEDLERTGLVQPASRLTWRYLVAGTRAVVLQHEQWLTKHLSAGQQIQTLEAGRPEIGASLDRARQFLSLVALVSALIASIAIALAANRFSVRHAPGLAVMRALGARQNDLQSILLIEISICGLLAASLGAVFGWLGHFVLVMLAGALANLPLPAATAWPALQAALAGWILMLGFAAVPIVQLAGVSPLRVLRRDLGLPSVSAWAAGAAGVLSAGMLLLWYAGDRQMALFAMAGFLGASLIFALLAWAGVQAAGWSRHAGRQSRMSVFNVALLSWSRRRGISVIQTTALAIGIMALMLLTVTRNDLLQSWQAAVPVGTPNRFAINIQSDQREEFLEALRAQEIKVPNLFPVVRGRLVQINGKAVGEVLLADERARRLIDREFNLSWGDELPAHNQVDSGKWIEPGTFEVSAESGVMKTLGLSIGDRLTFDVAGEGVTVKVVGTRRLAWDSMQVNFFMILTSRSLENKPGNWITSFYVPEKNIDPGPALVAKFPNITLVDASLIIRQVREVIERIVQAVQFLFVFALAAGVVVLHAAIAGSRDEREREAALMRALGASRRQLMSLQLIELALTGAMAGLMGSLAALAIGWALSHWVFLFPYTAAWWLLPVGTTSGAVLAVMAGWLHLHGLVRVSPLKVLRASD